MISWSLCMYNKKRKPEWPNWHAVQGEYAILIIWINIMCKWTGITWAAPRTRENKQIHITNIETSKVRELWKFHYMM